jgi:shikimate kinase
MGAGPVIVLVGFMGAGKTTVGRILARRLGVPFRDSDLVIEQRAGRPVSQIFAEDGEPAFRDLEHKVIADLLDGTDSVLALGGGAVQRADTRELLSGVPVVYLRVSHAEAMRRVGGDQGRPMLARPDVARLHAERDPQYAEAATVTVDAGASQPEVIAGDILTLLAGGEAPEAPEAREARKPAEPA